MICEDAIPWVSCMDILLTDLVRINMIDELQNLYNKMVLRGVYGDHYTVHVMCRAFLKEGRVEEYFRETKERGDKLDVGAYSIVIQVVCKKPNSNLGIQLLEEMKERGWVPSKGTFTCIIVACATQGNMVEALRLKDEMINCGKPMNLVVGKSLMKGYFSRGNFDSTLNLFFNYHYYHYY